MTVKRWLISIGLVLGLQAQVFAEPSLYTAEDTPSKRFLAQVQAHSKSEIETLLARADAVLAKVLAGQDVTPIQFVLHGEEVRLFFRENYAQNKSMVNRAAQLDAFNVIDIKVCETWLRVNGEPLEQLYPFVETVPLGPLEERRLLNQGYIYF